MVQKYCKVTVLRIYISSLQSACQLALWFLNYYCGTSSFVFVRKSQGGKFFTKFITIATSTGLILLRIMITYEYINMAINNNEMLPQYVVTHLWWHDNSFDYTI